MKPTVFNYADYERLQAELTRVTAERDARVEAVRCGECMKYETEDCAMVGYCDGCDCKVDLRFDETGYCLSGERGTDKEANHEND